jgi:hypothetical protein
MGTLAAAYASAGNFPAAIDEGERAVNLALAGGQTNVAREIQRHLVLYRAGMPYREGAALPTPESPSVPAGPSTPGPK